MNKIQNYKDIAYYHYPRSLDEIYFLRGAFAYEINILEKILKMKTLPKISRKSIEDQILRMKEAASGNSIKCYSNIKIKDYLDRLGLPSTLTRSSWENENR